MMTSSDGNIIRATGPLWGEFTGHRRIPLSKASGAELGHFLWSVTEQTIKLAIETTVIWDAIVLIMTSLWCLLWLWISYLVVNLLGNIVLTAEPLYQSLGVISSTYLLKYSCDRFQLIPSWTKWPPLRRRYFQMHLRDWKVWYFLFKFHWSLFLRVQLAIVQHWFR